MRRELTVKSRALGGVSDLTLFAPLKTGLVPSLESITYKSRVKLLLAALNTGRSSSHEYQFIRPFSDAVERVGVIHSVRVALVEGGTDGRDQVLLSVTFDGSWDAYIRILWQKVGPLLDVIFCNTQDYVPAWGRRFEEWAAWVDRVQIETDFFYATPGVSVHDVHFQRQEGRLWRSPSGAGAVSPDAQKLQATQLRLRSAEERSWGPYVAALAEARAAAAAAAAAPPPAPGVPAPPVTPPKFLVESMRQGLQAMVLIHRLTAVFHPSSEDGPFLLRAARGLLHELVELATLAQTAPVLQAALAPAYGRFEEQLDWLLPEMALARLKAEAAKVGPISTNTANAANGSSSAKAKALAAVVASLAPCDAPPLPARRPEPEPTGDVQAGILSGHPRSTHGALVLLAFPNRTVARAFIDWIMRCGWLKTHASSAVAANRATAAGPAANLAFTFEGLRALGLPQSELDLFPLEFREGMEARASVLGDVRGNHPRRWHLPQRNWQTTDRMGVPTATAAAAGPTVEMSAVHALLQLRVAAPGCPAVEWEDEDFPLREAVRCLAQAHPTLALLSVQGMVSHRNAQGESVEHFGFVDNGAGQPSLDPVPADRPYPSNQIPLGELLLGYATQADSAPPAARESGEELGIALQRHVLMHNGSFLVLRKLKQDVAALQSAVATASSATTVPPERILAKMMGREQSGKPLVSSAVPRTDAAGAISAYDFDFSADPKGSECPFQAHIRRSNPRINSHFDPKDPTAITRPRLLPGARMPRIMRRGMSYGRRFDAASTEPGAKADAERGMIFMAYNASIAEQFEVIQRWISGGNSTGISSDQSDPFMGVPENGQVRSFRFEEAGQAHCIALDGSTQLGGAVKPFVSLEWGAYFFTPSMTALRHLRDATTRGPGEAVWCASRGMAAIERLRQLERDEGFEAALQAWKALLEDPQSQRHFHSADVWAAIRERCDGVLRTPYGVIVADPEQVMQVLRNVDGAYSVGGYHARMRSSLGEIYLGLDDTGNGCPYRRQSQATNAAIMALEREASFKLAHAGAAAALNGLVMGERGLSKLLNQQRWELNLSLREIIDGMLIHLCQQWFGLPKDSLFMKPGGLRLDWLDGEPPYYPGHFTAPSRYIFQPHPGSTAENLGQRYGQALHGAFKAWVGNLRATGAYPQSPPAVAGGQSADAPLARTIFDAFKGDDDLTARTLIGALMGFLPTVDGALKLVLNEWLRDGSFWRLRQAVSALSDPPRPGQRPNNAPNNAPDFAKLQELLLPPMVQALQLRPTPEMVWRSAVRHGRLGDVAILPGDKLVLSLVSVTQEKLGAGEPDLYAMFGGDRKGPGPAPTHACPGYEAAMGVLLGAVAALLQTPHGMRPSPAPLALTLDGAVGG